MKKRFLAVFAAVAVIAGGFAVYRAQAAPAERLGRHGGPVFQQIVEKLGLTDDQVSKIKTELRSEKDTLVPLLKNLHESRKALRDAIHAQNASEAAVREAAKKVAAVETDLAVERLKLNGKIAPILTDEQIEKVKQFEEKTDEAAISILKRVGEFLEK